MGSRTKPSTISRLTRRPQVDRGRRWSVTRVSCGQSREVSQGKGGKALGQTVFQDKEGEARGGGWETDPGGRRKQQHFEHLMPSWHLIFTTTWERRGFILILQVRNLRLRRAEERTQSLPTHRQLTLTHKHTAAGQGCPVAPDGPGGQEGTDQASAAHTSTTSPGAWCQADLAQGPHSWLWRPGDQSLGRITGKG